MKGKKFFLRSWQKMLMTLAVGFVAAACNSKFSDSAGPDGALLIHFPKDVQMPKVPIVSVQNVSEDHTYAESRQEVQLDTNEFILSVTSASGASLYYGTFGAAPQKIITAPGSYTVTAKSCEFYTPLFSSPQYGDSQVAVVSAGKDCSVLLNCDQMNVGVRLTVDPAFLDAFPNGVIYLKSAEGKLLYGYAEKRIAYFRPGNISVVLNDNGVDKTLATYKLDAKDMLSLKLNVSGTPSASVSSGIHIQVDTVRNWRSDALEINAGSGSADTGKGTSKETALSVSEAVRRVGETDLWVYGFIVGGDLSSSNCNFDLPIESRTNIAIAEKSSCTDKDDCMSVQLRSGSIRDALNLVDNPGLMGRKVYLKGDIVEAYYGIPGIQSISEYSF